MVTKVEKIETALEPKFQDHFVNAMAFPNKVEAFPHLATEVKLPEPRQMVDAASSAQKSRRRRRRPTK